MTKRKRINYVGKTAVVRSCFDGSELPDGLPEGVTVKIIGFDIGHFTVEFEDKTFVVPMGCVANLHLLWNR